MSDEPSYPEDAAVGSRHKETGKKPTTGSDDNKRKLVKGVAVGIGSAAIVAALLYANRSRKNEKS